MNSCLYECTIMHGRKSSKCYRFIHKTRMFYLDLDELPQLSRFSWLLGYNQTRVYNFRDQDHISSGFSSVNRNIRTYLKTQGVLSKIHRIQLLTNLRVFGYIFNPMSFYFCFDSSTMPVCVVSEIGKTLGELRYFYLGPEKKSAEGFNDHLANELDFRIQVPDERLNVTVDILGNGKQRFSSSMVGVRKPLRTATLLKLL